MELISRTDQKARARTLVVIGPTFRREGDASAEQSGLHIDLMCNRRAKSILHGALWQATGLRHGAVLDISPFREDDELAPLPF